MNDDIFHDPSEPPTPPLRTFKREIPIKLSFSEIHDYGKRLARRKHEFDILDGKRKNVASQFKGQLAEIGADVNRLAAAIEAGEEMRNVDCYQETVGSQVFVKRADTHEVVDQRPATFADDQQAGLPFDDDEDDLPSANYQGPEPEMVTSTTGGVVAHMPDDDEGEQPIEDPVPPSNGKVKRGGGRKAKGAKS